MGMVVVVFGCDRCLNGVVGHGWVVGSVFGSWVTAWVTMVVVIFFFFSGYDRCLKGLWVVVGSGVWVVVGLWLKLVVGRGSAKLHTASLSSLIVDQRAVFGSVGWDRLMVGLKRWIC